MNGLPAVTANFTNRALITGMLLITSGSSGVVGTVVGNGVVVVVGAAVVVVVVGVVDGVVVVSTSWMVVGMVVCSDVDDTVEICNRIIGVNSLRFAANFASTFF